MLLISQHVLSQINCCFKNTIISQGILATHLRCGGIFSDSSITNVLLILTVN